MENDSIKLKIHYDLQEKKIVRKVNVLLFFCVLIIIVVTTLLVGIKYSFISIFFTGYLAQGDIPNYFVLREIKCPECQMNYFKPFLASRENLKSLLKSNPKCVSCNYEAEIISEYKSMY